MSEGSWEEDRTDVSMVVVEAGVLKDQAVVGSVIGLIVVGLLILLTAIKKPESLTLCLSIMFVGYGFGVVIGWLGAASHFETIGMDLLKSGRED